MLDAKARQAIAGIQHKLGVAMAKTGLSANALTLIGVVVSGVAAWRLVEGAFVAGALLILAGGFVDILDGAVAKATDTASPWGAFVDSVSDRLSDAVILGAIAWWFHVEAHDLGVGLALVCLVSAQVTSYIRARAESQGFTCRVGIVERAERLVILVAGLLFGVLLEALWVLAIGSLVTVGQRIVHVRGQARAEA